MYVRTQMCADRGYLMTRQELDETFEEFKASHSSLQTYACVLRCACWWGCEGVCVRVCRAVTVSRSQLNFGVKHYSDPTGISITNNTRIDTITDCVGMV